MYPQFPLHHTVVTILQSSMTEPRTTKKHVSCIFLLKMELIPIARHLRFSCSVNGLFSFVAQVRKKARWPINMQIPNVNYIYYLSGGRYLNRE
jgi:hypothetical protein